MSEHNNDMESLSRIREILFGDQIAALEKRLKELAEKQSSDNEKILQELNTLTDDVESLINDRLETQKKELMNVIKEVEDGSLKKKKLSEVLRTIADALDEEFEE
jgi:uncharacterized coiled-coil protein SlyX